MCKLSGCQGGCCKFLIILAAQVCGMDTNKTAGLFFFGTHVLKTSRNSLGSADHRYGCKRPCCPPSTPSAPSLQMSLPVGLWRVGRWHCHLLGPGPGSHAGPGLPKAPSAACGPWGRLHLYTSGSQISLLISSQLSNVTHLRSFPP